MSPPAPPGMPGFIIPLMVCGEFGLFNVGWGDFNGEGDMDIWYSDDGDGRLIPEASRCISLIVLIMDGSSFSTSSIPSNKFVFGFLLGGSGSGGAGDADFLILIFNLIPPLGVSSISLQV